MNTHCVIRNYLKRYFSSVKSIFQTCYPSCPVWETVNQRVCEVWESLSNSMQAVPSFQLLSQTPHATLIFRSQFCCYFAPCVLRVFCLCKTPHPEQDKANGKAGGGEQKMIETYSRLSLCCLLILDWAESKYLSHPVSHSHPETVRVIHLCMQCYSHLSITALGEQLKLSHFEWFQLFSTPSEIPWKSNPLHWDYFSDIKGCGRRLLISKPSRYEDINSPGAVRTDPNLQTNIVLGFRLIPLEKSDWTFLLRACFDW